MTKYVKLTKGKFALVDDEDFEYISQWKWCVAGRYAIRVTQKNKIKKMISMHREINKTPDGLITDHVNGDGFDNRKINLRTCTQKENCHNQRAQSKKKSSKFKGVSWRRDCKKWRAYIALNKKIKHLGYFDDEKDAAMAYNRAALVLHGDFCRLNLIMDRGAGSAPAS